MTHQKLPKIPIIELFGPTIQGEGLMTGTVTHFVRTGGCGLRCVWCDSLYAVLPAEIKANRTMMTIPEIQEYLGQLPWAPYVTLTGGDPCIHKHLGDLVIGLNFNGIRVAVETQGELFPDWLDGCDVITFSPKGPSSGNVVDIEDMRDWIDSKMTRHRAGLPFKICIKVVVFNREDFEYAMDVYDTVPLYMYDAFYLSAGTPIDAPSPLNRTAAVLHNEQQLAQMVLGAVQGGRIFNDKFHIGCQQHALLWPGEDRGV